jgi:Xaa-Pro aminopeptidase
MAGAARCAYPSVVAGGADATAIHYGRNDKRVAAGDLLLMDAGCE